MSKRSNLLLLCLLLLCTTAFIMTEPTTVPAKLNPGVVFEIEVTDHRKSPPSTEITEMSIEGSNIVIQNQTTAKSKHPSKTIFRGERREVIMVDDKEKGYYVMDEAAMKSLAGQAAAAMQQMEEALKNVPADQREMVEKMMRERMPNTGVGQPAANTEVKKTGEKAQKAGYPCVKYQVLRDGQKIRELWITDWDNIDGGAEAGVAFKEMGAFFDKLWNSMPAFASGGFLGGSDNPYSEMNFDLGFPVEGSSFDEDGSLDQEWQLKSARRERLDPSAFEPPSGYKRRSMGPQ